MLFRSDGDFIDLCKYLKKSGKIIEIWSIPGVSFNKKFCDYVDMIHFMNEDFFYDKDAEQKEAQ